jgi:hypothetical protein
VTFVRPDRWLGRLPTRDPEEAQREVARRFLATYGPAAADGFARWLGLRGAQPKRMLASLGDEATVVDVDGGTGSVLVRDVAALGAAGRPRGARLLPAFDPYVVATRPRAHVVAPEHETRIYRPQGWISPVVLVDGAAVGVWKHERGRVELDLFRSVSKTERRAIDDEAERLHAFFA